MSKNPIAELSLIVTLVLICVALVKFLKQPMIMGYVLAGVVAWPYMLDMLHNSEGVEMFGNIGVFFLLFIVGLWLNPTIVKELWKVALGGGLIQIVVTSVLWWLIALALSFTMVESIYVAIALTFSSTIVIIKLLSDKGVLEEVYARVAIGILIVQDVVAMILLMGISLFKNMGSEISMSNTILLFVGKLVVIGICLFLITKYILPTITEKIARSQEYLLLFSVWRCLLLGTLFHWLWYSMEIGALIAGITLATLPYRYEIMSKMKPLRDFFVVMFFVYLWSHVVFSSIATYAVTILIFSFFVLVVKPAIFLVVLWVLWFTRKNSFATGVTCAQISEFSFIVMTLWVTVGHITNNDIVSIVTLVGVISIAGSSYFIQHTDGIYNFLKPILQRLPFHSAKKTQYTGEDAYNVLVCGCDRIGFAMVQTLQEMKERVLAVDFNPQIIEKLQRKNIPYVYGDITDIDLTEELPIANVKMVISTLNRFDDTMFVLKKIKTLFPQAIVILVAHYVEEAISLYEQGADYVIVPHMLGSHHAGMLIQEKWFDLKKFMEEKHLHVAHLHQKKVAMS